MHPHREVRGRTCRPRIHADTLPRPTLQRSSSAANKTTQEKEGATWKENGTPTSLPHTLMALPVPCRQLLLLPLLQHNNCKKSRWVGVFVPNTRSVCTKHRTEKEGTTALLPLHHTRVMAAPCRRRVRVSSSSPPRLRSLTREQQTQTCFCKVVVLLCEPNERNKTHSPSFSSTRMGCKDLPLWMGCGKHRGEKWFQTA